MGHKPPWTPELHWDPIAGAEGSTTVGVWRTRADGRMWIIKRLHSAPEVQNPRSFRWWRREIEVATSGLTARFEGLLAPSYRVEEDDSGVTLWSREVQSTPLPAEVVATALGTFASLRLQDPGWFAEGRLRERITLTNPSNNVWADLPFDPTTRDLARKVWNRSQDALNALDRLPHVLSHGDALPRNLLRHDHGTVTAIDWDQLGYAPVGADLASYSMWSPSRTDHLLRDYSDGLMPGIASDEELQTGVAITTALIAVLRVVRTIASPTAPAYQERLLRARPQLEAALQILR